MGARARLCGSNVDDATAKKPADHVIGTGEQHSVEEFLNIAFKHVGLNYKDYVKIDQTFFRPAEVENLLADPTNSKKSWLESKN